MKLLLQHREENIKDFLLGRTNYNQFKRLHRKNLKKLANFFKLQSTFILAIRSQK